MRSGHCAYAKLTKGVECAHNAAFCAKVVLIEALLLEVIHGACGSGRGPGTKIQARIGTEY